MVISAVPAEPTPDALDELCKKVRETGSDIGFAHDGDADRVVVVTDRGVPLSGEWTLALVADFILSKTKGDIVVTVSTSRMLDDIVAKHGVTLHRTKVGVGWVVEKMHEVNRCYWRRRHWWGHLSYYQLYHRWYRLYRCDCSTPCRIRYHSDNTC